VWRSKGGRHAEKISVTRVGLPAHTRRTRLTTTGLGLGWTSTSRTTLLEHRVEGQASNPAVVGGSVIATDPIQGDGIADPGGGDCSTPHSATKCLPHKATGPTLSGSRRRLASYWIAALDLDLSLWNSFGRDASTDKVKFLASRVLSGLYQVKVPTLQIFLCGIPISFARMA